MVPHVVTNRDMWPLHVISFIVAYVRGSARLDIVHKTAFPRSVIFRRCVDLKYLTRVRIDPGTYGFKPNVLIF